MGRDDKHYKSEVKIKRRVDSSRKQMLLGNVTRITWMIAMTQFTHIMSRECQKLQLRVWVRRFGFQNAMVGRLDDLGAGRGAGREKAKRHARGSQLTRGRGWGFISKNVIYGGPPPRKLR